MTPWAIEQARRQLGAQERVHYGLLLRQALRVFSSEPISARWWAANAPGLGDAPIISALKMNGLARVEAELDAIVGGWP